jgi:hypothetical protein
MHLFSTSHPRGQYARKFLVGFLSLALLLGLGTMPASPSHANEYPCDPASPKDSGCNGDPQPVGCITTQEWVEPTDDYGVPLESEDPILITVEQCDATEEDYDQSLQSNAGQMMVTDTRFLNCNFNQGASISGYSGKGTNTYVFNFRSTSGVGGRSTRNGSCTGNWGCIFSAGVNRVPSLKYTSVAVSNPTAAWIFAVGCG